MLKRRLKKNLRLIIIAERGGIQKLTKTFQYLDIVRRPVYQRLP